MAMSVPKFFGRLRYTHGRFWRTCGSVSLAHARNLEEGLRPVSFGKHAGKTFADVANTDPKYCVWILNRVANGAPSNPPSNGMRDLASYFEALAGTVRTDSSQSLLTTPISSDQLTPEQRQAAERVLAGESIFLTGAAGTGKSFLLRYCIQELERQHTSGHVAVTASTGIAAANVGGQTLHSFAGIGLGWGNANTLKKRIEKRGETVLRWQRAKVLVIDEISMISGSLFEKLEQLAQLIRCSSEPFGGMQLLLCGDFLQLPPVPDEKDEEPTLCFQTEAWKRCGLDQGIVMLRESVRQAGDPGFASVLNEVRLGKISSKTWKQLESCLMEKKPPPPDDGIVPTKLHCFNKAVDKINNEQLDELPGKPGVFKATDTWLDEPLDKQQQKAVLDIFQKRVPKQLRLKVGAQVILIKNRISQGLVNGSRGVVSGFSSKAGNALVQFDNGGVHCISPELFEMRGPGGSKLQRSQLPLKLGWALTIHKAQGLTLTRAELDVSGAFEAGQIYVALSRLRDIKSLWITRRWSRSRMKMHPEALQFYADAEEATVTAIAA